MEASIELVCFGESKLEHPAHMSKHVSERLTPKPTEVAGSGIVLTHVSAKEAT